MGNNYVNGNKKLTDSDLILNAKISQNIQILIMWLIKSLNQ